ncbi:MAG: hypothetical protein RLZZ414_1305 [Bacteroidota bacterium]|jgi:hypothetical protein
MKSFENFKLRVLLSLFFVLIVVFSSKAQLDDKKEIIVVTGKGDISYEKGKKIPLDPVFKDTVKITETFSYTVKEKKVPGAYEPSVIKPPKIAVLEPLDRLYNGHVFLGANDFVSLPYLDFSYGLTRNKKYNAGVYGKHFSSGMNVQDLKDSRFSENNLGVYGKKIGEKLTLSAKTNVDYNTFRWYGYNPELFNFSSDSNKLNYTNWQTNFDLKKNKSNLDELDYAVNAQYNLFTATNEINEHLLTVKANVGKFAKWQFLNGLLDGFWRVNFSSSYLNSKNSIGAMQSNLFQLVPTYNVKNKDFDITAGFIINYLTEDERGFYNYGYFDGTFNLVKDYLIIYTKFDGGFTRHHNLTYYQANPFINSVLPQYNVNNLYNIKGGVKGAINKHASFNVGFQQSEFKDAILFVNDFSSVGARKFTIFQTDMTHSMLFGEVNYDWKKIRSRALFQYNSYSTFQHVAFHKPATYAQLGANYKFQNKLDIGLDLYYFGKQLAAAEAITDDPFQNVATKELKPILDFNLNVNYAYSKTFGAFILVNNILSQNHQRWNQYPNYGINFLAGVKFSF